MKQSSLYCSDVKCLRNALENREKTSKHAGVTNWMATTQKTYTGQLVLIVTDTNRARISFAIKK